MKQQKTLIQYFEWYLPEDAAHWRRASSDAEHLAALGYTSIWLPPAYKGAGGIKDVGYGVYDLYDLGEFDQKGSIPTKYGTKEEYLNAIHTLQGAGLEVLGDMVLNHRMGADRREAVMAERCLETDREQGSGVEERIMAWTRFTFPGRSGRYSGFHWNHTHFNGVDWDDQEKKSHIWRLNGKEWEDEVDQENGNFDYLMGANLDMANPDVIAELDRWGLWYLESTGLDGFRLDAVKHIRFTFFTHWLEQLRRETGKELWSVGEYWQADILALTNFLDRSGNIMCLFDVPLHFKLAQAAENKGGFDMRTLFQGTLVDARPQRAVTFVDNHDTQIGQALQSWVKEWFKPLAYALILLRQDGAPCVFYGDQYGIPHDGIQPVKELEILLRARQERAWGEQTDYFDHQNVVGWVRSGDEEHPGSGLAVLLSNGDGGEKSMCMGVQFAGRSFVDLLGSQGGEVTLDKSGCGMFRCGSGSVSVWVPKQTV